MHRHFSFWNPILIFAARQDPARERRSRNRRVKNRPSVGALAQKSRLHRGDEPLTMAVTSQPRRKASPAAILPHTELPPGTCSSIWTTISRREVGNRRGGSCEAIQHLLDELEASKQSRLRAWKALQDSARFSRRLVNIAIPPPAQKTFDAEGEVMEHALTKSLRIRNEAIKSLCASVRRFRYATIKEECKRDYPHALQALWKALDRVDDLIQN